MTNDQQPTPNHARATRATATGIAVNIALAAIKITTGLLGNSYALIADGIESSADILSSLIVWSGLKISVKPADPNHPYGHGKAESVAAAIVAAALFAAAILIAIQSTQAILTPRPTPAWFTLPILLLVIITKETLSRYVLQTAGQVESSALRSDAWHHRSDAITSAAAAVGITIALLGGKGYESADAWAALLASAIIAFNGFLLLRNAINELMDAAAPQTLVQNVRSAAASVPGVLAIDKCFVRKYGMGYVVDIHVLVDANATVRQGHQIAHQVKDTLRQSPLKILDALIHIEPG